LTPTFSTPCRPAACSRSGTSARTRCLRCWGSAAPPPRSREATSRRRCSSRPQPPACASCSRPSRGSRRAGSTAAGPRAATSARLRRVDGVSVWQEYFLLLEDDAVRGAYVLKRQDAVVGREARPRRVGSFYWPLSEGTIDPTYALVAPRLLQAALEDEPLLFLVGMVGRDRPIARLVRALGWRLTSVPFYFKPLRPGRFFRELRYVRRRAGARWVRGIDAPRCGTHATG